MMMEYLDEEKIWLKEAINLIDCIFSCVRQGICLFAETMSAK